MIIRKADCKDTEEILKVWYNASKIAHSFISEEMLVEQQKEIRNKYLPIAETWVAEENKIICGFISLIDHYVGGLFINLQYQGNGIGTALIEMAKTEKGVLTVGVYVKNINARAFYEKMGFVPINEELQIETGEIVLNMILNNEYAVLV